MLQIVPCLSEVDLFPARETLPSKIVCDGSSLTNMDIPGALSRLKIQYEYGYQLCQYSLKNAHYIWVERNQTFRSIFCGSFSRSSLSKSTEYRRTILLGSKSAILTDFLPDILLRVLLFKLKLLRNNLRVIIYDVIFQEKVELPVLQKWINFQDIQKYAKTGYGKHEIEKKCFLTWTRYKTIDIVWTGIARTLNN